MEIQPIPVAILAATGSVGQRFIQLLDGHPWFKVVALAASDRRAGQTYGEACHWLLPGAMPAWARALPLLPASPEHIQVPLVFSALPADIARQVEPEFARAGSFVCTNASAHRNAPDIPVLLPEVNAGHLDILPIQQKNRGWKGAIVTNPNCTSVGLTVTLKALQDSFGLHSAFVVSLQALSGAGYPGVASMDIIDNVIPFVSGEEDKIENEPRKMLGSIAGEGIHPAGFGISAHTNRVAVTDGHLVCLSVKLTKKASPEEASTALQAYQAPTPSRDLPSSPKPVIRVRMEPDRPQPRLDRYEGCGMTTVVGRLRSDALMDLKMVILSHNTIRGAAGGSIYNAELLYNSGYIPKR